MEFTIKEVAVSGVPLFWTKCFPKYVFLEMFELFNLITVQIWTAKCDFNKDYCNMFDDSNFDIDNYYFLHYVKLL